MEVKKVAILDPAVFNYGDIGLEPERIPQKLWHLNTWWHVWRNTRTTTLSSSSLIWKTIG